MRSGGNAFTGIVLGQNGNEEVFNGVRVECSLDLNHPHPK